MFLCNNNLIYNGLTVFIQVIFVFSFLVLFYFLYVIDVEKKDFQEQIDLLVDSLMTDLKSQSNNIISVISCIELLVKSHRAKYNIKEIPAKWIQRKDGISKFKLFYWTPFYLKWFFYSFSTTYLRRKKI